MIRLRPDRPGRANKLPVALRVGLGCVCLLGLSATLSACGASTSLGNDVLAPLSALPATDVVFETNLQSAVQGGVVQAGLSGSSALDGLAETTGAPTTTSEVSVAAGTGVSVYTAFNPADGHCLGTFVIAPGVCCERPRRERRGEL